MNWTVGLAGRDRIGTNKITQVRLRDDRRAVLRDVAIELVLRLNDGGIVGDRKAAARR